MNNDKRWPAPRRAPMRRLYALLSPPRQPVAAWTPVRRVCAGLALPVAMMGPFSGALRLNELSGLLALPGVLPLDTATATAADIQQAAALDLPATARQGLAYSLEVEAARQRLASFGYTRDAARGALLPRADVRSAGGRGRLESVDPSLTLKRGEFTATLRQTLIDKTTLKEWERQGVLTDSAALQLGAAQSNALLESSGAWLSAVQARVSVQLGKEYEALLDELSRYITERAAAGGASPADRERVRGRVANVRSSLADYGASLKVAALGLAAQTLKLSVPKDVASALDLSLSQNPELLAARTEARAAATEIESNQGRFLPHVEMEVSHARTYNAGGQAAYTRDTKAMLVVTVPLLNGGADVAQVRAARARLAESQAKAGNMERKLAQELETAYANLDASATRFKAVRDELDANAKVVAAFREQMVGSNRSLLEVLDAYQRLHQSRLDLTQALVSEAQSQLRVAHLTGEVRHAQLTGSLGRLMSIEP
jgi:adhesin transport system outer membrane protein